MPSPVVSVGVDVGGTWLRLTALDQKGQTRASWRQPSSGTESLPSVLRTLLRRLNLRPVSLIVASKGIWTLPERNTLRKRLRSLARHVAVMSDVEAAWLAAFRPYLDISGPKVLIVAGTGSMALGSRGGNSAWFRRGGLGPLLGDEGSGFWLGREWLRIKGAARAQGFSRPPLSQDSSPVQQVARYAPQVLRAAKMGSPTAKEILQQAQIHLASLVTEVAGDMKVGSELLCSPAGSFLCDNAILPAVKALVKKKLRGVRVQWVLPNVSAATAIAQLGLIHGR